MSVIERDKVIGLEAEGLVFLLALASNIGDQAMSHRRQLRWDTFPT